MAVIADIADVADHAVDRGGAGRARRGRLLARALVVAPVVLFLAAGWWRRFLADDAFINFRVVHQVLAGNGPVYNVGERVEVTTSTLWAGVLVVADLVTPFRLEWTALVLALALGAFGVAAGMAGAADLARLVERPGPGPGRARANGSGAGADGGSVGQSSARGNGSGGGPAGRAAGRIWLPAGAFAYLGVAAAWDWATGGLETGLGLAWMGATFWSVVRLVSPRSEASVGAGPTRRRLLATAVLVGIGVLVRPDFAAYVPGLGLPVAVAAWRRGRFRSLAGVVAAAAALPVAAQVFRMGYYGRLFPNTLYAKEGSKSWWEQGLRYLDNFVGAYWLVIPAALVGVAVAARWRDVGGRAEGAEAEDGAADTESAGGDAASGRAWRLVVGGLLASVVLHVVGIVRVGGDYMHARLLLSDWFGLLLPVFCVRLPAWSRPGPASRSTPLGRLGRLGRLAPLALVAWAASAAVLARPPQGQFWTVNEIPGGQIELEAAGIVDGRRQTLMYATTEHPVLVEDETLLWRPQVVPGHFEDGTSPPVPGSVPGRPVVAFFPLGRAGYRMPLDTWVYDRHGLADPVVARVRTEDRGVPGHEKALSAAWVAAQWVDPSAEVDPETFAAVPGFTRWYLSVPVDVPADEAAFEAERAAAAAALSCGELADVLATAREPLTPSRFFGNMVDAVRLDGFRFPADPAAAHRELC